MVAGRVQTPVFTDEPTQCARHRDRGMHPFSPLAGRGQICYSWGSGSSGSGNPSKVSGHGVRLIRSALTDV